MVEVIKIEIKNSISLLLFVVFRISFSLKLRILSQKYNLKAMSLGKKGKKSSVMIKERLLLIGNTIWTVLWLSQIFFEYYFVSILGKIYKGVYINFVGLVMIAIGIAFIVSAMISMKNAWRVGIDFNSSSELMTCGIYKISRNPAFLGFDIMLIGLFLTYPNLIVLMVSIGNVLLFHLMILEEEQYLLQTKGDKYTQYKKATPRYLWIK